MMKTILTLISLGALGAALFFFLIPQTETRQLETGQSEAGEQVEQVEQPNQHLLAQSRILSEVVQAKTEPSNDGVGDSSESEVSGVVPFQVSAVTTDTDVTDIIKEAQTELKKSNFDQAEALFIKALKVDPSHDLQKELSALRHKKLVHLADRFHVAVAGTGEVRSQWLHSRSGDLSGMVAAARLAELETVEVDSLSFADTAAGDVAEFLAGIPGGIPVRVDAFAETPIMVEASAVSLAEAWGLVAEELGAQIHVDGNGLILAAVPETATLEELNQEWADFQQEVIFQHQEWDVARETVEELQSEFDLSEELSEVLARLQDDREIYEAYTLVQEMRVRAFGAASDKELAAMLMEPDVNDLIARLVRLEGHLGQLVLDVAESDPERVSTQQDVDALRAQLKTHADRYRALLAKRAEDARALFDDLLAQIDDLITEQGNGDSAENLLQELNTALQIERTEGALYQAMIDALDAAGIRLEDIGSKEDLLAVLDRDADGFTNREEDDLGTNPDDASDFFRALVSRQQGQFSVRWTCNEGCTYRVLKRETLADGSWNEVLMHEHSADASGLVEWIDEAAEAGEQAFYRLEAFLTP